MGLDVYFRRDIANVLRAVANTDQASERETKSETIGPEQARVEKAYHRGVQETLVSVGLAFGLDQMVSKERQDGPKWVEQDRGAGQ